MDLKQIAKKNMAGLFPESYAALYPNEAAAMKAEQQERAEVPTSSSETINNTTATAALWQTVWEGGWVDKTRKLMTDLRPLFTDVSSGFDVSNPVAMPVVKINVVNSVGSALVDTADWETSAVNENWVNCQSHRISVPFSLTLKELTYGTTIRSKVAAAINTAVQEVLNQFYAAITAASVPVQAKPAMSLELAAELSSIFGDNGETDVLLLDSTSRSKLTALYKYSLDPNEDGILDIGRIRKVTMLSTGWNGLALSTGGVCGMIAEPDLSPLAGTDVIKISMGEDYGISFVLKTWVKPGQERLWCSVETVCGFVVTDADRVAPLTFANTTDAGSGAAVDPSGD